ncbi:MAG: hypothetical protein U5K54_10585 [Cytophagales bacterium]|nr:hypothetical protein [Cytophagales bacterium]
MPRSTRIIGVSQSIGYGLILSAPEAIAVIISYYLFRIVFKGKYWLPSTREFLLFIFVAIIIPLLIELLLLHFMLIYFGEQSLTTFGENFLRGWLGEFTANFGIATPPFVPPHSAHFA